ncbi:hypothetical protein TNCV_971031 [Trichonephila clavipes]|nr:hypothetical protein TNCV_971031 [Trichonephila clavipes]
MEVPLRTAYGQNGRCGMQPKAKHSLRAQAQLMRTETVETFELVKVKQKLLDIRERKENARGARAGERGTSSGVVLVTRPWFKIMRTVAKTPRVAEQCDVNISSLPQANSDHLQNSYHSSWETRLKTSAIILPSSVARQPRVGLDLLQKPFPRQPSSCYSY